MRSQHKEKQCKEKDVLGEKVHVRDGGLPARCEVSSSRPSAMQQKFGGLGGMKWSMEDTVTMCRKGERATWSSKGVRRWRKEQPERLKAMEWAHGASHMRRDYGVVGQSQRPGEHASGTWHSTSEDEQSPAHLSEEQPGCSACPMHLDHCAAHLPLPNTLAMRHWLLTVANNFQLLFKCKPGTCSLALR